MHRAQNDPRINDADAPDMVFTEISGPSTQPPQASKVAKKIKQRDDLEDEFGEKVRPNEGEAAEHGVYFDDSNYDYMQHMRELGGGNGGDVTWVPASSKEDKSKAKGKNKVSLEDALRSLELGGAFDDASVASSAATSKSLLPDDVLPSEFVRKTTYQDQQDIPDAIAGFQPDMDPRLREVLEALEDEAYVDDEEEDFFAQLAEDGEEVDRSQWEMSGWDDEEEGGADGSYDEDDDGWQTDDTVKPDKPKSRKSRTLSSPQDGEALPPPTDTSAAPPSDPTNGAWMEEFAKFKQAVKEAKAPAAKPKNPNATPSEMEQSVNTGLSSLASGRRKKRKGAMTNPSAYSMTSSALARTDTQTLLDARFDKIEEEYADGYDYDDDYDESSQFDDAESLASGMTGMSKASRMSKMSAMSGMSRASGISTYSRATDSEAPQLVRSDFDSIMDGFLAGHSRTGGRGLRIKKSGYQTGLEQLDEVRSGLGPARFKGAARAGR